MPPLFLTEDVQDLDPNRGTVTIDRTCLWNITAILRYGRTWQGRVMQVLAPHFRASEELEDPIPSCRPRNWANLIPSRS